MRWHWGSRKQSCTCKGPQVIHEVVKDAFSPELVGPSAQRCWRRKIDFSPEFQYFIFSLIICWLRPLHTPACYPTMGSCNCCVSRHPQLAIYLRHISVSVFTVLNWFLITGSHAQTCTHFCIDTHTHTEKKRETAREIYTRCADTGCCFSRPLLFMSEVDEYFLLLLTSVEDCTGLASPLQYTTTVCGDLWGLSWALSLNYLCCDKSFPSPLCF